jgi:hypothetical protein
MEPKTTLALSGASFTAVSSLTLNDFDNPNQLAHHILHHLQKDQNHPQKPLLRKALR